MGDSSVEYEPNGGYLALLRQLQRKVVADLAVTATLILDDQARLTGSHARRLRARNREKR